MNDDVIITTLCDFGFIIDSSKESGCFFHLFFANLCTYKFDMCNVLDSIVYI